jgi:hypothetical protein
MIGMQRLFAEVTGAEGENSVNNQQQGVFGATVDLCLQSLY